MKILPLVLLFGLLISMMSSAQEIKVEYSTGDDGSVSRNVHFICPAQRSGPCIQKCGAVSCSYEEPPCHSCGGTSSELLRILFTKAIHFYRASSQPIPQSGVIDLFTRQPFIVLEAQSPYNFYTDIRAKAAKGVFQGLCPSEALSIKLAVALDEAGFPDRPLFSICEMRNSQQMLLKLTALDEVR